MHDINEIWTDDQKFYCEFNVEETEKESYIKEVRTSSDPSPSPPSITSSHVVCLISGFKRAFVYINLL